MKDEELSVSYDNSELSGQHRLKSVSLSSLPVPSPIGLTEHFIHQASLHFHNHLAISSPFIFLRTLFFLIFFFVFVSRTPYFPSFLFRKINQQLCWPPNKVLKLDLWIAVKESPKWMPPSENTWKRGEERHRWKINQVWESCHGTTPCFQGFGGKSTLVRNSLGPSPQRQCPHLVIFHPPAATPGSPNSGGRYNVYHNNHIVQCLSVLSIKPCNLFIPASFSEVEMKCFWI